MRMQNSNFTIKFLGATQTVTGAKYLVTCGGAKILVDCGMFQGIKELRLRNWASLPVDPKSITAVVLTHAHIDHTGYLPLLVKNGFQGKVYCTSATKDLCGILLPDCGFLQEEEANRANKYGYSKHKPALPLYTMKEAKAALPQLVSVEFGQEVIIASGITLHFNVAGHILGAASVVLRCGQKKILFSGDLGRPDDPIMPPPAKREKTDYLVLESTYGDREHPVRSPEEQLGEVINRTAKRGGTLIIPAFAVGRTQNILYYIHRLKVAQQISNIPVFLDSPMAQDATEIFKRHPKDHRLTLAQCKETCGVAKYVNSVEESKRIDTIAMPKIIIAASGMAVGGRVLHHLRYFLGDHRSTVLFCGYQAADTRGHKMLQGVEEIKLLGEVVKVNAEIAVLNNISAHADSHEILAWLATSPRAVRKVFLIHGERNALKALQAKIEHELHWQCSVPKYLEEEQL
jgi:metallo-beta-lactamase family protein